MDLPQPEVGSSIRHVPLAPRRDPPHSLSPLVILIPDSPIQLSPVLSPLMGNRFYVVTVGRKPGVYMSW